MWLKGTNEAPEGYAMGLQSASELTEEIDDFLEKTESEYISDDDELIKAAAVFMVGCIDRALRQGHDRRLARSSTKQG